MPRSLLAVILTPPGSSAPSMATTMWSPAWTFGAPQTICSGTGLPSASTFFLPTDTWQIHMWSELG